MSFFSDLFKGAKSHFSEIGGAIKDDPERLFLGGLKTIRQPCSFFSSISAMEHKISCSTPSGSFIV